MAQVVEHLAGKWLALGLNLPKKKSLFLVLSQDPHVYDTLSSEHLPLLILFALQNIIKQASE
jgi:hypothetical protein